MWLPVIFALKKMLKELHAKQELGFLGYEAWWFGNPLLTVQYWRSYEALSSYARSNDEDHLPSWIAFKDKYGKSAAVGLWHEAYIVEPEHFETTYKNMPTFGLARATSPILYQGPLIKKSSTASKYIGN